MSLQQLIKVLVRQRIRNFIRNVSGQANLLKVELNFTVREFGRSLTQT